MVLAIGDGDRHARVEARDLATGEVQWQTPVPASFEEAIEPAVDDHSVAVVDHFGVVTVLDPETGQLRWQHDLADVLIATRVVLAGNRVAFTSYAGVLHVLDRRDGHVVQTVAPARARRSPGGRRARSSGLGRTRRKRRTRRKGGSAEEAGECSWPCACGTGASNCGAWRRGPA